MQRERAYRVVVYLAEEYKDKSDRMWASLIALDAVIIEEHTKAGAILVETLNRDLTIIERIPGVVAIRLIEPPPEEEKPAPAFSRRPTGNIKPIRGPVKHKAA